MARHNFVFLYGRVTKKPTIVVNEQGKLVKGQCIITTIRGDRSPDDDGFVNFKCDCPVIMTKAPDLIYEMSQWQENDMVEVKGNVTTRDIPRLTYCENCGHQNTKKGVLLYITPIFCTRIESCSSEEECNELLKKKCEISNQCIVAGNLCNDPDFYVHKNGLCQIQYQIALNRKFRIKEDPPEIKTDFPWIKSYGENARMDAISLKKGASVLVEGYIQTREIEQKAICEDCEQEYRWKDRAMEIVPYSTEYLMNCRSMDEIKEEEQLAQKKIFKDIFGTN